MTELDIHIIPLVQDTQRQGYGSKNSTGSIRSPCIFLLNLATVAENNNQSRLIAKNSLLIVTPFVRVLAVIGGLCSCFQPLVSYNPGGFWSIFAMV